MEVLEKGRPDTRDNIRKMMKLWNHKSHLGTGDKMPRRALFLTEAIGVSSTSLQGEEAISWPDWIVSAECYRILSESIAHLENQEFLGLLARSKEFFLKSRRMPRMSAPGSIVSTFNWRLAAPRKFWCRTPKTWTPPSFGGRVERYLRKVGADQIRGLDPSD